MTSSFCVNPGKKAPESLAQQGIPALDPIGKDEVGSSNLPSSSKSLES